MCQTNPSIEWLDFNKIKSSIAFENQAALARLDLFDSINSTNTYLLEQAKTHALSGSVCIAEEQTLGRGRQGRTWFSPRGANIYCSILWHVPLSPMLPALSLAVAVMVGNALKKYGVTDVGLKWPNDILYQGKKLAGILLESLPAQNGLVPVVIGIGLNLQLPKDKPEGVNWIDVAEITGQVVERNCLAGLLVNELLGQLKVFAERGFEAFINEWNDLDVLRGKEVSVTRGDEKIVGAMQGVSEIGELLLLDGAGELQCFQCGEVSVREAARSL